MRVLVTGAFGLVGRSVLRQLLADGHHVLATDLRTPDAVRALGRLAHARLEVAWGDLTEPATVRGLLRSPPDAVVHLAGVIPPRLYARPELAARVNVAATRTLVSAVAELAPGARVVLASSMGVYGACNPHTMPRVVDASTPARPSDLYGAQKLEAEDVVRASGVDWVVLRLAAVIAPDLVTGLDLDQVRLERALPADGKVHAVDVRDVAHAFGAALSADCVGEVLLIGGDRSTMLRQAEMGDAVTTAIGFAGVLPSGLPGDPGDDDAWFCVHWLDTTRAQALLGFQRHAWEETLATARESFGVRGRLGPALRGPARWFLARAAGGHGPASAYADPWGAIARRYGEQVLVRRD